MSYDAAILADSPSIYYAMPTVESGSSLANTGSGGGTGGFSGTYTRGSTNLLGKLQSSKSVNLNGGYITTGFNPFSGDVTFEGWARRDSHSTVDTLVTNTGDWANTFTLYCGADTGVTLDASGAFRYSWAGVLPSAGTPFHWALTWNGSEATLYINGTSRGSSGAIGGVWPSSPGNLLFGGGGASGAAFNGELQKLAVYPSVVSAVTLAIHYQVGVEDYIIRPTTDLKSEWTISTGVDAWAVVDDAVDFPTAPTVPGDYLQNPGASSKGVRFGFTPPALDHGEYVDQLNLWTYAEIPNAGDQYQIQIQTTAGHVTLNQQVGTKAPGWNLTSLSAQGAGDLDWGSWAALIFSQSTTTNIRLYAVYLAVITSDYSTVAPELDEGQSSGMRLG